MKLYHSVNYYNLLCYYLIKKPLFERAMRLQKICTKKKKKKTTTTTLKILGILTFKWLKNIKESKDLLIDWK